MRKFLLRCFGFVLLTVVVYIAAYLFWNYKNHVAVRDVIGCEVLSTCNSHEQCGIDPDIFPEYGNLNSVASTPWVWEAKLRLILNSGKCHPRYLLVERGCHEVLWGYSEDDVAQLVARFLPLELKYRTCPYYINWELVMHYAIGCRSFQTEWAAKPCGFPPPERCPVRYRWTS